MLKAFILICSQQPAEAAKEALEASAHGPVDQLVEGPQSARQEPVERKVLQHVAHVQHELDHACQEARNGCTLALGHLQVHLRRGSPASTGLAARCSSISGRCRRRRRRPLATDDADGLRGGGGGWNSPLVWPAQWLDSTVPGARGARPPGSGCCRGKC